MNNLIHERVRNNPLIRPGEIVDYVKVGGGIDIKYYHAYHALELSHKHVFGNDVRSYTYLARLVNVVKETNPGSFIDFDFNDATKRFNRLFICFGACREGYKLCRPMIFCDCTFITGTFRGGLMAATCFYPLAYASVSGETNDNWECYFYFHLDKNLPIAKSDEKDKEVIDAFRKETYALSPATYEEAPHEMTSSSVAESFNNWINRDRNLPACALVDKISLRIMELMSERHEESVLMNLELLTHVYQAFLELHIQIARPWKFSQSDANLFEVHSPRLAFTPITRSGGMILDYVEDYFKVTRYRELYSIVIRHVPNYDRPDEYHVDDTVLPPDVIKAPPGRKKGKRIKSTWENSRKYVKCSNLPTECG
ncbi:uncharacterized protein LOC113351542 [Papaver somniferum]|uniref:uncharacterized protein LOC113351542 n=1 Tax=Papaver somniferum TaxID=3469 RepID=UPI000E6F9711|nr:uncharacterized protein LOC113351542 [Papaver somniferum]